MLGRDSGKLPKRKEKGVCLLLFCFFPVPLWSIVMIAATPAAILENKGTFRMDAGSVGDRKERT